jgi:hypothetical protein
MRIKRPALLTGIFIGISLGASVCAGLGQHQFERVWQRVQTDHHSIPGDPGSYLCAMGYAPMYAGMLGALSGLIAGLSGGRCWLRVRTLKIPN